MGSVVRERPALRQQRSRFCISTSDQPHLSGPVRMSVRDWPLIHRNNGLRGRWAVTQSTVGSFGVVMFPPFFDDDLGFAYLSPMTFEEQAVKA